MYDLFSDYAVKKSLHKKLYNFVNDSNNLNDIFSEASAVGNVLLRDLEQYPIDLFEIAKDENADDCILGWQLLNQHDLKGRLAERKIDLSMQLATRHDPNLSKLYKLKDLLRYEFSPGLNIAVYDYWNGDGSVQAGSIIIDEAKTPGVIAMSDIKRFNMIFKLDIRTKFD